MNDLWPLGLTCSPCKMMLCTCPSGFQRNHFFPGGNRWSSGLARCHVMYTFKQNKEHAKFTTGEDICKPSNKPSAGYKEGNVPSLRPHLTWAIGRGGWVFNWSSSSCSGERGAGRSGNGRKAGEKKVEWRTWTRVHCDNRKKKVWKGGTQKGKQWGILFTFIG